MLNEVWRELPYDVGSSERHFALSDSLVRTGEIPTLWWHSTNEPTLIVGNSGSRNNEIDEVAATRLGWSVVRRHSGGTAVFADQATLGLDAFFPRSHRFAKGDIVEGYAWLGRIWVQSLRSLGVEATLVSVSEARRTFAITPANPKARLACFGSLSPYEVMWESRKLVGHAQVRRGNGVLFQSAIHFRFPARELARILEPAKPEELARALERGAVGLDEVARHQISAAEVRFSFEESLRSGIGVEVKAGRWTDREMLGAAQGATS